MTHMIPVYVLLAFGFIFGCMAVYGLWNFFRGRRLHMRLFSISAFFLLCLTPWMFYAALLLYLDLGWFAFLETLMSLVAAVITLYLAGSVAFRFVTLQENNDRLYRTSGEPARLVPDPGHDAEYAVPNWGKRFTIIRDARGRINEVVYPSHGVRVTISGLYEVDLPEEVPRDDLGVLEDYNLPRLVGNTTADMLLTLERAGKLPNEVELRNVVETALANKTGLRIKVFPKILQD